MIIPRGFRRIAKGSFKEHVWISNLQEFDGPLVAVFRESYRQDYLYFWHARDQEFNRWLACPVSRDELSAYLNGDMTLLDIYQSSNNVFLVDFDSEGELVGVLCGIVENLEKKIFPPSTSYFQEEIAPEDLELRSPENFEIKIDGKWFFHDFAKFERRFHQLYSFVYPLENYNNNSNADKLTFIAENLPWRRGGSSVSFFSQASTLLPSMHETSVASIRYASPGEITLSLQVRAARKLKDIVYFSYENRSSLNEELDGSISFMAENGIRSMPTDEVLTNLTLKKALVHVERLVDLCGLEKVGFDSVGFSSNPVVTLKVVQSVVRKLRDIHDLIDCGKVTGME